MLVVAGYIAQTISSQVSNTLPHRIDFISFIIACSAILFCFTSLLIKTKRANFSLALISYYFAICICTSLIVQSGNITSPYLALVGLISLFVYPFGILAIIGLVIMIGLIFITGYPNNLSDFNNLIMLVVYGPIGLTTSLIIWLGITEKHEQNDIDSSISKPLANAKLNEFTNEAGAIINSIGDAMVLIDSLGIIKLINPAAQTITGWSSQEAVALNYKSVIKLINQEGKDFDDSNNPIAKVLNYNQQIRSNDCSLLTKNNKNISISLVVSPLAEAGAGVVIVFHDITKEKNEEREQAEFISTASHEMRTPIASIEGYIGLAMNPQTAQIDVRARDYLNKAQQSAQHLGQLFQDLLDISQADDGRIKNNPAVINLVVFLKEIIQNFEIKAKDKNIKLKFKPQESINGGKTIIPKYLVNLDPKHLREILDNLIDNGIKYTPQQGEVSIDISGDNNQVTIAIKDNGIGIASEDIGHLFQKFYRIDNKDTREINGTGLGLYLCRRLTEVMGGRIWVKSSIGVGTTFFVQFSRLSESQAEVLIKQASLQLKPINPTPNPKPVLDIVTTPANTITTRTQPSNQLRDEPKVSQTSQPNQQPALNNSADLTVKEVNPETTNQTVHQSNTRQPNINQFYRNSRTQSFNIPKR